MTEQQKQTLQELKGTAYGFALKVYLEEEIGKMSDMSTLTPENVVAKKEACQILENLFRFLEVKTNRVVKTKYN